MEQQNNKEVFINVTGFQCLDNLQNNTIDLSLETCGIQNCFPGHWFGPGKRDLFLIHFICGGKGIFESGGKTYHLSKGDFFVIFPDTEVHYEADHTEPWDYMWVGFVGVKAESYLNYAGIDRDHVIGQYSNTSFLFSCIQQMLLARSTTPYNELKRTAALLTILSSIIEEYHITNPQDDYSASTHQEYLDRALKYIDKNLSMPIKISDIANYVGINRSYLTNIFKHSLGVSPQEYLIQYRLDYACMLLEDSDTKISNIAKAVGYADSLTFSKIFRKMKGMSPSAYRKKSLYQSNENDISKD